MKSNIVKTARTIWISVFALITAFVFFLPLNGQAQAPQEPVGLGDAGGFTILAASLISSVPTSAIIGNVGLSPAAGSEITGLTAVEVDGKIYTVDESGPAGSEMATALLTQAKMDLTTAYNDAAGRTPVPEGEFLNTGGGEIGGMALVPGLYKFADGVPVSITNLDVTLSGSSTDVWIFQIASTLTVGNGTKVILDGGALAENVFWQVGTSATLGSTSVMRGTIMADQSISLATGAEVEGRLLARIAAITLSKSTVYQPGSGNNVVRNGIKIPQEFALIQIYPNPFNSTTRLTFGLPFAGHATLSVYDLSGRLVETLFNGERNAGAHTTIWNAGNLPSGLYIMRLENGNEVDMRKVTLIR